MQFLGLCMLGSVAGCRVIAVLLSADPALRWSPRRICNQDIISRIQQVICFAFHDSNLLLETCRDAKEMRRIVTLFYLD